jgi:hypothetical protein
MRCTFAPWPVCNPQAKLINSARRHRRQVTQFHAGGNSHILGEGNMLFIDGSKGRPTAPCPAPSQSSFVSIFSFLENETLAYLILSYLLFGVAVERRISRSSTSI